MSFNPRDRRNPYLLTWALRGSSFSLSTGVRSSLIPFPVSPGIIEDPQVRELFGKELTALREAFEVRSVDAFLSHLLGTDRPLLLADLETSNQDVEGGQTQAGRYQNAAEGQGWQALSGLVLGGETFSARRVTPEWAVDRFL